MEERAVLKNEFTGAGQVAISRSEGDVQYVTLQDGKTLVGNSALDDGYEQVEVGGGGGGGSPDLNQRLHIPYQFGGTSIAASGDPGSGEITWGTVAWQTETTGSLIPTWADFTDGNMTLSLTGIYAMEYVIIGTDDEGVTTDTHQLAHVISTAASQSETARMNTLQIVSYGSANKTDIPNTTRASLAGTAFLIVEEPNTTFYVRAGNGTSHNYIFGVYGSIAKVA